MHLTGVFAISCLASVVISSPISSGTYTVHEKRDVLPQGWSKAEALDRGALLPMKIALAQKNLDKGRLWLDDVSNPESANYGKHWTANQVAEAFRPSDESVAAVKTWLVSSGIRANQIKQSQGRNWLEFEASVDEAERLLNAKYHVYRHEHGQPHVACDEYSIPSGLADHIDLITPTVHFDAKLRRERRREDDISKREVLQGVYKGLGAPGSSSLPKGGWQVPFDFNISGILSMCDKYITPDCLRALYEFPPNILANPRNSYGM